MRPLAKIAIGLAALAILGGAGVFAAESPIDPGQPFIRSGAPENAIRHLGPRVERTDEGYIEMPRPYDPPIRPGFNFKPIAPASSGSFSSGGALPSTRGGGGSSSSRESAERQVRDVIRKLG